MRRTALFTIWMATAFTAVVSAQSGNTYSSKANGFSFRYPAGFRLSAGKAAASDNYFGDPGMGKKIVKVSPRRVTGKYHGNYEYNVWASEDTADKCGAPAAGEFENGGDEITGMSKTRVIDGHTFYSYLASDAGMSKTMGLKGYRALVGKKCLQIQFVTNQVSAYDDFTSFDYKALERGWEKFLKSVKFSK